MNNMWGSMAQYQEINWPWPIAIYLFLAGLSAGSIIVALLVKWLKHDDNKNNIWDAMVKAGAIIGPIAICAGLALLVLDLGKPFSFYWILIKYNFTSVMSIGVLCLLIYTPCAFLFALYIFEKEILNFSKLTFLSNLTKFFETNASFTRFFELFLLVIATCVGAYTGFLLSAIAKIPLWNTPILPILFLVSGFSSGIAANILVGMTFFKGSLNKESIKYLLTLDFRAVLFELPILFTFVVGLYFEGGQSALAISQALHHEVFGKIFWIGIIGVGIFIPILLACTALKNHAYRPGFIVFQSVIIIISVILLRFFVVYAGQICTGA